MLARISSAARAAARAAATVALSLLYPLLGAIAVLWQLMRLVASRGTEQPRWRHKRRREPTLRELRKQW